MWMIRGSPRTPNRLPMLSGSCVQQSEVFRIMTCAHGPYNLGSSTTMLSTAIKAKTKKNAVDNDSRKRGPITQAMDRVRPLGRRSHKLHQGF